MRRPIHKILSLFFLAVLLVACAGPGTIQLPSMEIPLRKFSTSGPSIVDTPSATQTPPPVATFTQAATQLPTTTATVTPLPYPLWFDPSVPDALREETHDWNLPLAGSAAMSSLQLGLAAPSDTNVTTWIYALVAPFPTVRDGVALAELETAWKTPSSGTMPDSPLWMTESTLDAMTALLGEPGEGAVKTVPADKLVDTLWTNQPSWGIVPFESLEPKLKVLTVDKQSPVRNDFDESAYPLKVNFALTGSQSVLFELPATNRDPAKLTVVMMTGVTALVRATAIRMEIVGLDYPCQIPGPENGPVED